MSCYSLVNGSSVPTGVYFFRKNFSWGKSRRGCGRGGREMNIIKTEGKKRCKKKEKKRGKSILKKGKKGRYKRG